MTLFDQILEIVCRGKHKRGGPSCEITCGIQVASIVRIMQARVEAAEEAARDLTVQDYRKLFQLRLDAGMGPQASAEAAINDAAISNVKGVLGRHEAELIEKWEASRGR